jgi:EmrB/QacA subfamily drug resistance transporter
MGVSGVSLRSRAGRWTVIASIAGSGTAFVEGSIVNVALPAIARDLGLGVSGVQWVVDAYLLSLSALILLGGSMGDVFSRRRVFIVSLGAFAALSAACALAWSPPVLFGFRLLQGMAGAMMVPNSLALLETMIEEKDRASAIGQWSGWSAVTTAIGPLLGGWLVDVASWRWVFACMTPLALFAAWAAWMRMPELAAPQHDRGGRGWRDLDLGGAALATASLTAITVGLLVHLSPAMVALSLAAGVVLLGVFVAVERRVARPLLCLEIFRSRAFTMLNVSTLFIYAALSAIIFLLMLELQNALGYSAITAGASLLPTNALMLALSPLSARVAKRIGPRLPIAVGALVAALGAVLLTRVQPGATYIGAVLPAIVVFGLGLSALVAPLTAGVLAAVADEEAGIASAVNNAAARLAGLIAVAAIPLGAGLARLQRMSGPTFVSGFVRAMWICAALCGIGAVAVLFAGGRVARKAT